ncbi:hypothetical protein ACFOWA_15845 [Pedobacter lithocola]|uniref:Uncharacterized protein n=1 Tax=Pedobacter lithocola TaxID=1908239 RepID=A0ABV8PEI3_9SPHI
MPSPNIKSPGVYINYEPEENRKRNCIDMVGQLPLIVKELNTYLKALQNTVEDFAVIASLVGADGAVKTETQNRIVVQLLTIQNGAEEGGATVLADLLITANFDDQIPAINQIAHVADFFRFSSRQDQFCFLQANTPSFGFKAIDCSAIEYAQIFKALGAVYKPSLWYQISSPINTYNPTTMDLDGNALTEIKELIKANVTLILRNFVFSPNTYSTWLEIKYQIDDYLFGLWEQKIVEPKERRAAYNINVGLGISMTANDILQNTLIISLQVALDEPGVFTELTFQSQLAGQG